MKFSLRAATFVMPLAGAAATSLGQAPDSPPGAEAASQPTETVTFAAHMLSSNVVPPVSNAEAGASGDVTVTLLIVRNETNTITFANARFDVSLTGFPPTSSVILAHIHQGGPTSNGPVRVDLGITPASPISLAPTGSGSFSRASVPVPIEIAALLLGNPAGFYFDVHTPLNPDGAVRGQLRVVCVPSGTALCLNASRFRVEVTWRVPSQGTSGVGLAASQTVDSGQFYFFTPNNIELVVKVVDGTAFNGKYWVFYGALSDVEYTMKVTDVQTGRVRTYFNPSGNLASVADTSAF